MTTKTKITIAISLTTLALIAGGAFYAMQKATQKKTAEQATQALAVQMQQTEFETEKNSTIEYAKGIYAQLKRAGLNFESGPCLSNGTEWVVDVAHSPRLPLDDNPANQCAAYVSGMAKHFVELDLEGNVIRAE